MTHEYHQGYNIIIHNENGFYTWTTFKSEEEFERMRKEDDFWKNVDIPARGISDAEAGLICHEHNDAFLRTNKKEAIQVYNGFSESLMSLKK